MVIHTEAPLLTVIKGTAFRMSQDLGLQRDPKHWLGDDFTLPQSEDVEIGR